MSGAVVALRSRSGVLEAGFNPGAGMVGTSLRHHGDELLGREARIPDPVLAAAMRGIPLLHPWANRLTAARWTFAGREARVPGDAPFVPRDGDGLAIHGLIAPPDAWTVEAAASDRVRAVMDFGAEPARAAAFPFPHRLVLEAVVGDDGLAVTAAVEPVADVPVPVAFGFHPYLRLPGVPRTAWRLEVPAGLGTAVGDGLVDETLTDLPAGAELSVTGGTRRLTVRLEAGFPVAQVYAPAGQDVICLEPMTAPVDALVAGGGFPVVGPGERFEACFTLRVEDAGGR